ncbi:MAG: hypothetical protein J0L72_05290 [Armatimonadetes bacterium]|nr:hypothetical protein [Armatimonadota bacterium]
MITPFDWQESMGHRASFVQTRLQSGTPVLMASVTEGILAFTMRRNARKLFEIYDRLMFSAIGQQSDMEQIRVASIDFAHQEGFNRSEEDVTIQRVVSAISAPLKRAFADFNTAPFVVQGLFAEVADSPEGDQYYLLDFDGDFTTLKARGYLCGSTEGDAAIHAELKKIDFLKLDLKSAIAELQRVWALALSPDGKQSFEKLSQNLVPEVALLERAPKGEQRFKLL